MRKRTVRRARDPVTGKFVSLRIARRRPKTIMIELYFGKLSIVKKPLAASLQG